jgi:hypothetical protein
MRRLSCLRLGNGLRSLESQGRITVAALSLEAVPAVRSPDAGIVDRLRGVQAGSVVLLIAHRTKQEIVCQ